MRDDRLRAGGAIQIAGVVDRHEADMIAGCCVDLIGFPLRIASGAEDIDERGKNPRIEDILKNKQLIVCQVTKNPIAHKGARLTQEVSLPGRFVVLIPNSKTYGISKRLPDDVRTDPDPTRPACTGSPSRSASRPCPFFGSGPVLGTGGILATNRPLKLIDRATKNNSSLVSDFRPSADASWIGLVLP